ncbi:NYN domain-containing protein [Candidatus Peregrinibacteria bacterium]|nr:MAG: NYN domain-containing protein [Candidatus Peregrinibacteria bacterium]
MSFRFHLQSKTLVLIDWANVYNWTKRRRRVVDPERLYQFLRSHKNVDRICLFAGEDDHPKSREFLEQCREIGFEVFFKPVKYVPLRVEQSPLWEELREFIPEKKLKELQSEPILYRKCDFDVEISKEILLNIDSYHAFILFSGDGDYAPVIEELLKRERRVFVVSKAGALGRELREMLDKKVHPLLVDVESLPQIFNVPQRKYPPKKSGFFAKLQELLWRVFQKK